MSEYATKIFEWVMTAIASIGGLGTLATIAVTIIKTCGTNSINKKLLNHETKLNKTIENGFDDVKERINTDITVNVSAQVNDAVERETRALREHVAELKEEINIMRDGLATVIDYEAERNKRLKQDATYLIEQSAKMRDIAPVEHIEPAIAHVSVLGEVQAVEEPVKSKKQKVVI